MFSFKVSVKWPIPVVSHEGQNWFYLQSPVYADKTLTATLILVHTSERTTLSGDLYSARIAKDCF